jgi:hypothetical protein
VLRTIDRRELAWFQSALTRAKGKFILVILGHPLYAGGRYQGANDEPFAALHQLLKEHQVPLVMAGDTHDLELYLEPYRVDGTDRTMRHVVNGGGGAYLSIGTPLDWPRHPALPNAAYYPAKDALIAKLDRQTSMWKTPLWWWVKYLDAWPLNAETMAGAFDNNFAPYFQSFIEVRVEGSANRVRLIAHSANGPLHWRDLQRFGAIIPDGQSEDDVVELSLPLPAK